jgi:hypothetical protein
MELCLGEFPPLDFKGQPTAYPVSITELLVLNYWEFVLLHYVTKVNPFLENNNTLPG